MNIYTFVFSAVCGVLLALTVKKDSPGIALLLRLALCAALIIAVLGEFKSVVSQFGALFGAAGIDYGIFKIPLKVFGILTAGTLCADICRDNSESAAAGAVELGCAVLALSCALPVFESLVTLALSLLENSG